LNHSLLRAQLTHKIATKFYGNTYVFGVQLSNATNYTGVRPRIKKPEVESRR